MPDPRREQGRVHRLGEILFIATCAVLCGADNWVQIADYAHSKFDWLQTLLTLPGGIPSHDTFRRVSCLIDPLAFQKCFSAWITALLQRQGLTPLVTDPAELKPIAIDGKTQRGSARRTVGRSALHVVSAWAVENRLTLGQVATDAKSHEITAIPELLELLDLKGVVDVCFREDEQRHWAGNSAQNLAWLRKMALCLLKAEKHSKGKSIATRRLLAEWKDDYLLSVLAQIPENPGA